MANNQNKGKGNRNQAPQLIFNGDKFNTSKGFYQIPQELADIIFNTFSRKPALIRLMLVLTGTEPGFFLSEKWVMERTGLAHKTYLDLRKQLEDIGWLTCNEGKVIVNFDTIYRRIESIPQNEQKEQDCIESIRQMEQENLNGLESIPQIRGIQSIRQKRGIESIPQKDLTYPVNTSKDELGYSVNTSNETSLDTSKDDLTYSLDTNRGIESIPIIDKENINIDINNLQYITNSELSQIVGNVVWLGDDIVQLPNGNVFRVKKDEVNWSNVF